MDAVENPTYFLFSPWRLNDQDKLLQVESSPHADVPSLFIPGGNFYTLLHGGGKLGAEYDSESVGSSVH